MSATYGHPVYQSTKDKIGDALRKKITYSVNENGCHICTSQACLPYPQIQLHGKLVRLHRLIYEQHAKQPIQEGMEVLHKCDTPACINPDHLFLGTQKDNLDDCRNKKRNRTGNRSGALNPAAKFTEQDIRNIRQDPRNSHVVAKVYGVSYSAIWCIRTNRTWTHLS